MSCTEHVADPVVPVAVSAQDRVGPKVTGPVGVVTVPRAISATVAVQLVDCPNTIVEGEHETVVLVVLRLTVTVVATLVLVLWVASPLYVAVIIADPEVEAVKVEEHVAVPVVVPGAKLHGLGLRVPPENATVPVGVVGAVDTSVTVIVQVDAW